MLSVMLGNFEPHSGEKSLADAAVEMVSTLHAFQRQDARGETLEGFDAGMLENLRAIDFENFEMRLVPCSNDKIRLDLR